MWSMEGLFGKIMSSFRGHSRPSEGQEEDSKLGPEFQELTVCIQRVSSCQSQAGASECDGPALAEAVLQLTECLALIRTAMQGPAPSPSPKDGHSSPAVSPSSAPKEDALLSLASQLICQMYILKANNLRLFQKLKKALDVMLILQPQTIHQINNCAERLFAISSPGKGIDAEDLSIVSSLLESSDIIKGFLRHRFPEILGSVAATLRRELSAQEDLDRDGAQTRRLPATDACYQATKVFLQMCQHGETELQPLLWQRVCPASAEALSQTITALLNLLEDKQFSKDNGLMAGCALSMMLNSSPRPEDAAEAVTRLLSRYSGQQSDGKIHYLQIGQVVVRLDPINPTVSPSLVFATIAFVRGVLTCCSKSILSAQITTNQKRIVCLLSLFPTICELCEKADGELKYHASEAVTLYLQAARSDLPRLLEASPAASLFGPDTVHARAVLRLVWRDWQSPVDGVAELMRSSLSALLDLCSRENRAGDNGNLELVDSITSTLLATAWHVKGRYHLLTGLVPHCSALSLLASWPDLPGELLRCLGTNYLAAAASELHGNLVRRMRKEMMGGKGRGRGQEEEEEAELTAGWSLVWKEVMMEGLMSADSLTRYHASKYWLPAALKAFPGIFRPLMEGFAKGTAMSLREGLSDERHVRCLHAQIVLLRYARTNALLKSDWLDDYWDIVSAGLWHPEDDVQADSLGLLCCTPKRSELPSGSEMDLLRQSLPLCLDSDSAALRNQLRHHLNTFVCRLCDGGLALWKQLRKLEKRTEPRGKLTLPRRTDDGTEGVLKKEKKKEDKTKEEKDDGVGRMERPGPNGVGLALGEARLKAARDWLDWLVQLCFGSLFPGACYQRKRTALDILGVVFECLLAGDTQKKTTDGSVAAAAWAVQSGKCDLLSERNASVLLECVQDISNDLRSSSCRLLASYFPASLPASSTYPCTSSSQVLCRALQLVSSPRLQESEAGALLTQLIFIKHLVSKSAQKLRDGAVSLPGSPVKAGSLSVESGTVHFIESLLTSLTYQLKCCRKNMLQASSATPMHGLIRAIRRSMTDQPAALRPILALEPAKWTALVDKLLAATRDIADFVLAVLAGRDAAGSAEGAGPARAPSFGQMGEAIERLVAELASYRIEAGGDGGGDGEGMSMAMSEEHQLVLACCWLNLKECSLLLGSLAETLPLCSEDGQGVLTLDQLTTISAILVDILTRCRHKGAIDGCNQGFAKLCVRLLASHRPELRAIPKAVLDRVFGLVTESGAGSSFTKKSAGLPLLVESILGAEPRGRERPLLAYAVGRLLGIAGRPLPTEPSGRLDMPQSHALNILMVLFRCSALGTDILVHCPEAVVLAVRGFASPCWTIRNGSMRLFGTLITRIFGQKKVQDEHSQINAMSATSFFASYPDLRGFLLAEMAQFHRGRGLGEGEGEPGAGVAGAGEGARLGGGGRLFLHPSLHPVLTLLSKLGPGVGSEEAESLGVFVEPVRQLAGSAIYAVRELVARALVPLVPPSRAPAWIASVVDALPSMPQAVCDANRLHGNLLQVQRIFESAVHSNSVPPEDSTAILAKLETRLWLATDGNRSAVIRALYVTVAMAVITECCRGRSAGSVSMVTAMRTVVREYLGSAPAFQIGGAVLNTAMAKAHLALVALTSEVPTSDLLTSAGTLLTSRDPDVQLAALDFLRGRADGGALRRGDGASAGHLLRETLVDLVTDPRRGNSCLEGCLTLWTDLGGAEAGPCPGGQRQRLWSLLVRLSAGDRGSGLVAASLPAAGRLLGSTLNTSDDRESVCQWCDWMVKYSDPSYSETIRLAVVRSMALAAPGVWRQIANERTEERLQIALSLLKVLLSLLQDELQDLRQQAAAIVSLWLPRGSDYPKFRHLHSNAAQQVLISYICRTFSWSSRFMASILEMLQGPISVLEAVELQEGMTGGTHLFEQESANIYAEGVMEAKALYAVLEDTVEGERGSNPEGFRDWVAGWLDAPSRLHDALVHLADTQDLLSACVPMGGTFYSVSSHSRIYEAVCRQLLYIRFLHVIAKHIKAAEHVQEVTTGLVTCAQQILEVPSVHPCLKMELSSLLECMGGEVAPASGSSREDWWWIGKVDKGLSLSASDCRSNGPFP